MTRAGSGAGVVLLFLGLGTAAGPQEARKPSLAAAIDGVVRSATPVAEDGEFLRRVMLDLVGYPPTLEQVKAFLADTNPGKRTARIEELVESDHFADLWSRQFAEGFFGDYTDPQMDIMGLGQDAKRAIVADFIGWFRTKLQKDRPYTEIVFEMLDAKGKTEGDPALAYKLSFYYGDGHAAEFASGVSRQLMGVRLLCARCHPHPFENFDQKDYWGLAAFNARQKVRAYGGGERNQKHVELREGDDGDMMGDGTNYKPQWLVGGGELKGELRMTTLARYMTARNNVWLTRAAVNRVWSWLFGRGAVHPVDDFSQRNREVIPILGILARDFSENKYSIKHLVKGICNSKAYQLACASDKKYDKIDFSRGTIKQLTGEQLVNSIEVATRGKPERNQSEARSMVATLYPAGAVWCEVTPLPGNARQALLLRNNSKFVGGISGGGVLSRIKSGGGTLEDKIDDMFLAALSRKPLESERQRYANFIKQHGDQGFEDAYWTLLNTSEFVTRH